MQKQITLNFFDEKVKVEIPKNISALRTQISKSFLFSPNDAEEIILTYNDKGDKIIIQNEEDYKAFLATNLDTINLEISQESQLYQKNLNQISEEVSQDKKKLEELLQKNKELKEKHEGDFSEEKKQMGEISKQIKELVQKKMELGHKIREGWMKTRKEIKENEKQIAELQKKLGMEVTVKPDCHERRRMCHPFFGQFQPHPGMFRPPFMWGPHRHHHMHRFMKKCEKSEENVMNQTMPEKENPLFKNAFKEIGDWTKFMLDKTQKLTETLSERYRKCMNCPEEKKEKKEVHFGFICDGCEMNPIKGIRYKCKECPDFDFCEECYKKNKETHKHEFQTIEKSVRHCPPLPPFLGMRPPMGHHMGRHMRPPFGFPMRPPMGHHEHCPTEGNVEKLIHFGVKCDGCGVFPIVGCRYKCGVCPNFDFCEECEKKLSEKHGHPLIKITNPRQRHQFIRNKPANKK